MRPALIGLPAAAAVSNLGTGMTMLAIPWFVLESTGSGTSTGLVVAAETVGLLVGSACGGPWIDRLRPHRAAVLFDLCGAAVTLTIPLLHRAHALPLGVLAGLCLALGLSRSPGDAARTVLVPDIAHRYGIPVERISTSYDAPAQGARSLGAPVGGAVIAVSGAPFALYLDAVSFAVSALIIGATITGAAHGRAPADGYLRQIRDGVRFLRRDRLLSAALAMIMVTNGLNAGFFTVLVPAYGARVLHSAVAVGLISAAAGTALILGSVLFSWLGLRWRRWPVLAVCYLILLGPRMAIFLVYPPVGVLVLVVGLVMLAFGPLNPILDAVKAERTPPRLRARVFGALTAGALLGMPLGTTAAGLLLDGVGLTGTILAFTIASTVMSLCPLVFRAWREVDQLGWSNDRRTDPCSDRTGPSDRSGRAADHPGVGPALPDRRARRVP